MKNFKVFSVVILLSLFAVFTSCEKDDDDNGDTNSIESQLVGKWTGEGFYEDGELSPFNEFFVLASAIEFKTGGTGTSTSFMGSQSLTWSYDASTEILHVEMASADLGEGVTIEASSFDAKITKLDSSSLWFTYDDEGVSIEERYKK